VQGVGYRPFVYNRAVELGLSGTVYNGSGKVFVHAEGDSSCLERLEQDLVHAAPPLARPQLASSEPAAMEGFSGFAILASEASAEAEIHVPPDLFVCADCLDELTGPEERRFAYPFINCTQCGPRYTIITAMPYDRPNTSMAGFPLCDDCRAEYQNPADRRFHAQPLACPVCGPQLEFVLADRSSGIVRAASAATTPRSQDQSRLKPLPQADPLQQAIEALNRGQILAIKGVGGYHLVCDAANDEAVRTLRQRKRRPHKPLAVMFPLAGEDGLDAVRAELDLDDVTARALLDPARPIVLAPCRSGFSRDDLQDGRPFAAEAAPTNALSPHLAPGLHELGAFLPYSPLHHELLGEFGRPLVATSGNVSGEPVITDNAECEQRLAGVADAFLHHDRPIVRPADDPVVRTVDGKARAIRLGRGIAPLERVLPGKLRQALLATGGHMKNTVALAWDGRVVISPHIGDLDSPRSNDIFNKVINDIQLLYDVKSQLIACDLHPAYSSTRWAEKQGLPVVRVQHHAAHASSLAGEHPDIDNWLIFAWDGVGYGSDGTLWGGEALAGSPGSWKRVASFRPFKLVGGDKAGREPWRSAAALLWAEDLDVRTALAATAFPGETESPLEPLLLAQQAWKNGINTFQSSAVGRIFDAAAALVLGRNLSSFEGQGPMELEQAAQKGGSAVRLPLSCDGHGVWRSDWAPLLPVLSDPAIPVAERAGIFHESMARALVDQALEVRVKHPFDAIGLSGGVFQNRFLSERVVELLDEKGIDVRLHQAVPANDGGLCYGQVIEALALQGQTP
jgi:hydrogenase maturation protein HypF